MAKNETASAETLTVDAAALKALVEAQVEAKVQERLAAMNMLEAKTADDRFKDTMDHMRGRNGEQHPEEEHACESPATGATFKARVIRSRSFPKGRVVELLEYTEPAGYDVHTSDGGLVPDGVPIRSKEGSFTPQFKMWRYQTFWRRDLSEFVGKPFASYISATEAERRRAAEKAAE